MPRVKGGYTTRRRRKAVLKLAKGYYGSKHTYVSYKHLRANETPEHVGCRLVV